MSIAHSVFSASSSKRWMTCPASIRMSKGFPNITNRAAELGTAAHELGEFCLRFGCNTYDCIDMTFNKHVVDAAMCDAVQLYVGHIRAICVQHGVNPMLEKRVTMTSVGNDVFGTSDCIIIIGTLMIVIDYKNGFGVVEVHDNSQACFYAVATLDELQLWDVITKITTTIIQPRADHIDGAIRSCDYNRNDMIMWQQKFKVAVDLGRRIDTVTVAGEHCHYCPTRATCRARMERTIALAGLDKPLYELTADELVVLYREIGAITTHLKAVGERVTELARGGKKVEGYKLVHGIARASWPDVEAFVKDAKLSNPKLKDEQLYTLKAKGMTDMKKIVNKDLVNKHYVKPDSRTTLVPINAARPAISTGSAKGVFNAIVPSATGVFGQI